MEKIIKLMAKSGLFFANADGKYDEKEKNFINGFVARLKQGAELTDEAQKEVEGALERTYTLDEIVDDTKTLLADFDQKEQLTIKLTLARFIKDVIAADGVEHPAEKKNFEAWVDAIA